MPDYLAPEIVAGKSHTTEADWWGLGILLYYILVGKGPFQEPDILKMYHSIQNKKVIFPENT